MRPSIAAALLSLLVVTGCAGRHAGNTAPPDHAHPIIVREFAFSPGVVTLDPTLGYSLHRGTPGVPRVQRAEGLGRAAAFNLADAMRGELRRLGYDVVAGDASAAQPQSALVVSGDFRRIYEGHRHEGADIAVAVAIDYDRAGAPAQRVISFQLESRRLPREGLVPTTGLHGEDVNYEATRLGAAIGRYVAGVARTERWPGR